jgi:hypothetical protein
MSLQSAPVRVALIARRKVAEPLARYGLPLGPAQNLHIAHRNHSPGAAGRLDNRWAWSRGGRWRGVAGLPDRHGKRAQRASIPCGLWIIAPPPSGWRTDEQNSNRCQRAHGYLCLFQLPYALAGYVMQDLADVRDR